jgi:hypothetical protein
MQQWFTPLGGQSQWKTLDWEASTHWLRGPLLFNKLFRQFTLSWWICHLQYALLLSLKTSPLKFIAEDDDHIETILSLPGVNFESIHLPSKASDATSTTGSTKEQKVKYHTFTRDTVDYVVNSIGHRIGLQTQYDASSLKQYTIKLRKPQDALLKRKYKNAIKQHDTLDMLQDAVKLGLVSYAEILGHGLSHIYRGGSTLDVGKGFVGGLGASKERRWAGLSGDKA